MLFLENDDLARFFPPGAPAPVASGLDAGDEDDDGLSGAGFSQYQMDNGLSHVSFQDEGIEDYAIIDNGTAIRDSEYGNK